MDKCELHPHCYKSELTPCPACASQAALDAVRVMPRKMTMSEIKLERALNIAQEHNEELEDELWHAHFWRVFYTWLAGAGWFCLLIYSVFGGPEV